MPASQQAALILLMADSETGNHSGIIPRQIVNSNLPDPPEQRTRVRGGVSCLYIWNSRADKQHAELSMVLLAKALEEVSIPKNINGNTDNALRHQSRQIARILLICGTILPATLVCPLFSAVTDCNRTPGDQEVFLCCSSGTGGKNNSRKDFLSRSHNYS